MHCFPIVPLWLAWLSDITFINYCSDTVNSIVIDAIYQQTIGSKLHCCSYILHIQSKNARKQPFMKLTMHINLWVTLLELLKIPECFTTVHYQIYISASCWQVVKNCVVRAKTTETCSYWWAIMYELLHYANSFKFKA